MSKSFKKVATIIGIAAIGFATAGMGLALLGGGTLFGAASVFGMTTGLTGAFTLGTIASLGALSLSIGSMPGPPVEDTGANDRGTAFADPDALGCYVFGTTTVQSAVIYEEVTGSSPDRVLHDVFAHAWHRIESYEELHISSDDGSELVTFSGNAATGDHADMLWWFRAVGTQVAALSGSPFDNNAWPSTAIFEGVAHSAIVWNIDDDNFKDKFASVPTKFDIVVEGAWLYDPRLDTGAGGSGSQDFGTPSGWTFNNGNAILVLLRIMIGEYADGELVWGRGIAETDYDIDNFMAMADVADETLDSKPRFRLGGMFMLNGSFEDFVQRWEAETGGKLTKSGGIYRVWIPHDDLTSLTTITEDNLLAGYPVSHSAGGIDGLYNTARGRYIEPTEGYHAFPYPQVDESSAVTEDGGRRILFHDFSWVQDVSIAERVARIKVRRSRFQRMWTIAIGWAGFGPNYKPFTVHTLNIKETGGDAQLVRVVNREMDPMTGVTILTLQQEDASIYDDTIALGDPHASNTIPNRISQYSTITPRYVDGVIISPDGWTPVLVNVTRNGQTFTKTGGAASTWDSSVYSVEGYAQLYVSFAATATDKAVAAGYNVSPEAAHDRDSLDACWFLGDNGNAAVYESGVSMLSDGAYAVGDRFSIVRDYASVRYYKNGVLKRTVFITPTAVPRFLDSSIFSVDGSIGNLTYGPIETVGTNQIDPEAASGGFQMESDDGPFNVAGAASQFQFDDICDFALTTQPVDAILNVSVTFDQYIGSISGTQDVSLTAIMTSGNESTDAYPVLGSSAEPHTRSIIWQFNYVGGDSVTLDLNWAAEVIGGPPNPSMTATFSNVKWQAWYSKR